MLTTDEKNPKLLFDAPLNSIKGHERQNKCQKIKIWFAWNLDASQMAKKLFKISNQN